MEQVKSTLLKFQKEMEEFKNQAERIRGGIDVELTELQKLLPCKDEKLTPEKVLEKSKEYSTKLLKDLKQQKQELLELVEGIEIEYEKIKDEETESLS